MPKDETYNHGEFHLTLEDIAEYERQIALDQMMDRIERDRDIEDADNLAADWRDQQEFIEEARIGLDPDDEMNDSYSVPDKYMHWRDVN